MASRDNEYDQFKSPPVTDFHGRRRELIKLGVKQGHLNWSQIEAAFNKEFINEMELETLLFTCEQMDIEIKGRPS